MTKDQIRRIAAVRAANPGMSEAEAVGYVRLTDLAFKIDPVPPEINRMTDDELLAALTE